MHGRCQQTKTEKQETATCVPSSSESLLLACFLMRARALLCREPPLVTRPPTSKTKTKQQETAAYALPFFCLCSHYHASTRALVCRKPPLVTKLPTGEAEIEPQETVAYVPFVFSALALLSHESTRALACRKPPLVTKPPTSEAEIEPAAHSNSPAANTSSATKQPCIPSPPSLSCRLTRRPLRSLNLCRGTAALFRVRISS